MNHTLTLAIPCRADEPGLEATLESLLDACRHPELPAGLVGELLICINGLTPGIGCAPLTAVRKCSARHRMPVEEVWLEDGRLDKPRARFAGMDSGRVGIFVPSPPAGEREPVPEGPIGGLKAGRVSTKTPPLSFIVLLTERRGKPPAWNALWRRAVGDLVLFCDADVRVDQEAVFSLYARLQQDPHLQLVAAREVP